MLFSPPNFDSISNYFSISKRGPFSSMIPAVGRSCIFFFSNSWDQIRYIHIGQSGITHKFLISNENPLQWLPQATVKSLLTLVVNMVGDAIRHLLKEYWISWSKHRRSRNKQYQTVFYLCICLRDHQQ